MSEFLDKYSGYLAGVMKWDDLSTLWQHVREQSDSAWYIYAVGDAVPLVTATQEQLLQFIDSIDELLRNEHEESYCGIVYTDNAEHPSFIKIYDPNNLGVVCGFSDNPPLPGWVMSQVAPQDLELVFPPSASRKRWWQKIFA
jgi:hypothetical protein